MSASVLAVCVVHKLRPDSGPVGTTAIDKRPVSGSVRVGAYGVYADVQADRRNHGGLDQAVYAYSQDDAAYWADALGRELPPGWFGENLRVDGMDLGAAKVGERWRIGDKVIVEVTTSRHPCQTFARWVGGEDERGWVKRFSQAGRLGAYLRVVTTGRIEAGDEITVLERPDDAPTILEVYRAR
ncbi:MOSC domain-containing protein [Microbacterium sp. TWP3-1-2b2]|uniref:MOSC domain-containing protein n=1 Tax=Microbacterium sp. TWP3-1-2b2 TaxID=2804651 RepID=UPI003CEFEAB8